MNSDHKDDGGWTKVPELAWLRWLVTALAGVMILGMVMIVALLWLRLSAPVLPVLPASITLPAGARAQAVTFAPDAIMVLTDQQTVLVYDRDGRLRGTTALH